MKALVSFATPLLIIAALMLVAGISGPRGVDCRRGRRKRTARTEADHRQAKPERIRSWADQ